MLCISHPNKRAKVLSKLVISERANRLSPHQMLTILCSINSAQLSLIETMRPGAWLWFGVNVVMRCPCRCHSPELNSYWITPVYSNAVISSFKSAINAENNRLSGGQAL